MAKRFFAVTAVGSDRPGIVARLSGVLYEAGANIEDSSMTILVGQFAMILIVSVPDGIDAPQLREAFAPVADELGLFITVEELAPQALEGGGRGVGRADYIISVIAPDRPGIVYRISSLLAGRGVNITDMNTKVVSGEERPVYTMVLEVGVPEGVDPDELAAELAALGRELSIDVSMRQLDVVEL